MTQTLQLYVDSVPGAYHLEAKEKVESLSDTPSEYDLNHTKLTLGTSAFLRLAADLSTLGYKVKNLGLTDFRLKPLDSDEASFYQQLFIRKLKTGNSKWVERFLSSEGKGVFVVTVEFQSPNRDLVRLERQGVLRIEPSSKDEFIDVLEDRLAGK